MLSVLQVNKVILTKGEIMHYNNMKYNPKSLPIATVTGRFSCKTPNRCSIPRSELPNVVVKASDSIVTHSFPGEPGTGAPLITRKPKC